jgi:hypothetical protein
VMNHRLRTNDPLSTEKGSTLDAHMAGRRIPLAIGDPRRRDGAFMEPSGRNPWQPVPNGTPPKTAQTSRSATGGNPRQPFRSDGKEGVNGSSPLEGFAKAPYVGARRVGVAERFTVQGRAAWSFLDCSADLPQVVAERVRRIVGTAGTGTHQTMSTMRCRPTSGSGSSDTSRAAPAAAPTSIRCARRLGRPAWSRARSRFRPRCWKRSSLSSETGSETRTRRCVATGQFANITRWVERCGRRLAFVPRACRRHRARAQGRPRR